MYLSLHRSHAVYIKKNWNDNNKSNTHATAYRAVWVQSIDKLSFRKAALRSVLSNTLRQVASPVTIAFISNMATAKKRNPYVANIGRATSDKGVLKYNNTTVINPVVQITNRMVVLLDGKPQYDVFVDEPLTVDV